MGLCSVIRFLKPKKNYLSWAFPMVPAPGWLWGRAQCNLFICSRQIVLHSFYFIQLFIFIMFVEMLYFETSDPLGKVRMNSFKNNCGKNDRLFPSRDKFYTWRQAKRAGRDLVWHHIKLESRVKESDFKTVPESLQSLDPVVQSWAPSEHMDHSSQIVIWDISVQEYFFLCAASLELDGTQTQTSHT